MHPHRSVIWRLAALVFLLQLVCVMLALAAVHQLTDASLSQDSHEIADTLRDEVAATYADAGPAAARAFIQRRIALDRSGRSVILLLAPDGRRIAGNIDHWPASARMGEWRIMELVRNDRPDHPRLSMGLASTRLPDGARLLTGHVVEEDLRFGGYLEQALLGGVILALPLAAITAWLAARLIRIRLRGVTDTAAAIGAGDLHRRIVSTGGDDVFDALGDAINAMLDRIAGLVDELRLVTDGLAHDLRSPLTRLRAGLERALIDSRDENAIVALERGLDETDLLQRMLNAALLVSRTEAGIGRESFAPLDISALLVDLGELYGALAEEGGTAIEVAVEPALIVSAHRELLGQALSNLIDNALKYGGDRISMSARRDDEAIVITIADNGSGIAEERRDEAMRRFARLDASRHVAGMGLGLSLVAAVARLHGGQAILGGDENGLVVSLTLPAAARAA